MKGRIIWFYGLPSSGKTTLADLLAEELNYSENILDKEYSLVEYKGIQRLDGDVVREDLTSDLGFSIVDRFEHIKRVAFVADLLSKHGICVICSFITPMKEMRQYLRRKFEDRLLLIYVETSEEECINRDVKGLWKKALKGEIKDFTGVSSPFEKSFDFDMIVLTEEGTPTESAENILKCIKHEPDRI